MNRTPDHSISPLFTRRWSPRAMSGAPLPDSELLRLFEAARWAPSCANIQPWRFVYALRDTPDFDVFFGLLAAGNQPWCARASALVLFCADMGQVFGTAPKKRARLGYLDVGAAWMSFALQASEQGLVAHGMEGFDHVKAKEIVGGGDDIDVLHMAAVGLPGSKELLAEHHQKIEEPNARRPVSELAFRGRF